MRAFIAIGLPARIKNTLTEIQHKLNTGEFKVNWVKPQNLHLTLKFLGDISPEQLEQIKTTVEKITDNSGRFKVKLGKLGVFPDLRTGRIIWAGAEEVPSGLKQLVERLEAELIESGIPKELRPFCAHITIGRIKSCPLPSVLQKTLDRIEMNVSGPGEFNCEKVILFESRPGPGGPVYTALKELNLKIS
ncbi:MAG: RNA 2',3'-cyclic phosphodiesterase [Candidatus Omnitrophica bacterium]|jgi:2'-5' RNA ligase|nr:RNA 2',3'-cyclic phosphodiesterase [Candidatus Omnitrophota bacterium]